MRLILGLAVLLTLATPASAPASARQAARTPADRLSAREFPSIFLAWQAADNLPNESRLTITSRYDLVWQWPEGLGLRRNSEFRLLTTDFTPASVLMALGRRSELLRLNPNIVILAELHYRDHPASGLPDDHPWWQRNSDGDRILGWDEGGNFMLDWANPEFRRHVAEQARVLVQSGVVDGVLMDWWNDQDDDRIALLRDIRAAIGPEALIVVNSNVGTTPNSAPYVNGLFLETLIPSAEGEAADWQLASESLLWAEANLRAPRINALETWTCLPGDDSAVPCTDNHRDRLNRMRATTTLVLTHSNGLALFADPNGLPSPDHLHSWYPFWDKSLGRPTAAMVRRPDRAFQREFAKGTVVYNPIGNTPVRVTFSDLRVSAATGTRGTAFTLDPMDGDLYLRPGR